MIVSSSIGLIICGEKLHPGSDSQLRLASHNNMAFLRPEVLFLWVLFGVCFCVLFFWDNAYDGAV